MILVVCALRAELQFFETREEIEIIASGVGPIEAAAATARALAVADYAAVLNAGLAGVFRRPHHTESAGRDAIVPDVRRQQNPSRAQNLRKGARADRPAIGEAVLVTQEFLADFGLEGGTALTLPDGVQLVERVLADEPLVVRCADLELKRVSGLTVTSVTATDKTAERLAERYPVDVESMEGFAVLRAAALAGVPALEVRGISNYVGDRSRAEWNFAAGAQAVARGLGAVLDRLSTDATRSHTADLNDSMGSNSRV